MNKTIAPGLPAHKEGHLSDSEANRIIHEECRPQLAEFIAALGMAVPVSTDQAGRLLEHMIKESRTAGSVAIEGQLHLDHWENSLSYGETVAAVADRIYTFLATEDGIRLFNFFVKIFAKTTDEMYD